MIMITKNPKKKMKNAALVCKRISSYQHLFHKILKIIIVLCYLIFSVHIQQNLEDEIVKEALNTVSNYVK